MLAQQDLTLFQLSGIPQTNMVSPGEIPEAKFVFGLPFLSSVNVNYNNFSFSNNQGINIENNTLVIDPYEFVNQLKTDNYIYDQAHYQALMFGYHFGKNYVQLSVSNKAFTDVTFPKSVLDFILQGNGAYLGQQVSIEGLGANGVDYNELSLGYARVINHWSVGIHTNLLFGLANVYTRNSSLSIYTDPETYDVTIDGNIEINTSGLDNFDEFGNFISNTRNFGFGIDVGATFYLNKNWKFSSSLLDMGTFFWKHNTKTYTNNGEPFIISGLDIKDFISDNTNQIDTDSLLNTIRDSITNVFTLEEIEGNYKTPLTPKWYFGVKYILTEHHRFYGTVNLQFFRQKIRSAFSLGYEYRLQNYLSVTLNYSYFSGSYNNLGLGLQFTGGPFQIYLLSDNVLAGLNFYNYRTIHYRFGINFLFGRQKSPKSTQNRL